MIHVCIHGHFYQPPRYNPWRETIDREPSAHPFHDWNERIAHECYAPNRAARRLDGRGRITRIVNNYERISFNFGPTLLNWMKGADPRTYRAVLEADRQSRKRFDGHGSALAQAFGHVILPLANTRDKRTQVRWGVRDFEARFGRPPDGMWLPETAVDSESLDILAAHGIRFTVLAPGQAAEARPVGAEEWEDVTGERVDPTRPYRVALPSGRTITVFFYNGPVSRAVAFEQILSDGRSFARRLTNSVARSNGMAPLSHIATDGETYGHHHRHGEMALAYALELLEEDEAVHLTNYAAYLAEHEPTHEARIVEDSSWSCAHGIERWRSDCGCKTGAQPELGQAWRTPLRGALDWLREELIPRYEEAAGELLQDPWTARDDYIEVLLDRSRERVDEFLDQHARRNLGEEDRARTLRLLELQRHAMMMYTSCGWFFDDLSGIETLQVMKHAGRALQLGEKLFGDGLEDGFLEHLGEAWSNVPEAGSGADLYRSRIRPLQVDLFKVGAHFAVTSLFEGNHRRPESREPGSGGGRLADGAATAPGNEGDGSRDDQGTEGSASATRIYCYEARTIEVRRHEAGPARMLVGQAHISSLLTRSSRQLSFAVLHMGDHNLVGGVREAQGERPYQRLLEELEAEFRRVRFPEVIRLLDRHFHASTYSLHSLFPDEQERIVERILEPTLDDAIGVFIRLYESRAPLMRFLAELGTPQPRPFRTAGEFAMNTRLEAILTSEEPDVEAAHRLVAEAAESRLELDRETLGFAAAGALSRLIHRLEAEPRNVQRLRATRRMARLIRALPFPVEAWSPQNAFYRMAQDVYPTMRERADGGDDEAREWTEHFLALREKLTMAVP